MFPRHVWCRVLIFIGAIFIHFEAISKTDVSLYSTLIDSMELVCAPNNIESFKCKSQVPDIPESFKDSIAGNDLADFRNLGGNLTGLENFKVIIMGQETDDSGLFSGSFDSPILIRHSFHVFIDFDENNIPEDSEFFDFCVLNYIVQDQAVPSCRTRPGNAENTEGPPIPGSATGADISPGDVSCPPNITTIFECLDLVPPVEQTFTDTAPGNDLAVFRSTYGGDVTGTPDGNLVITAFDENDSDIFNGCFMDPIQVRRTFFIWDDVNQDGILEQTEFVFTCLVNFLVIDLIPPVWEGENLDQDLDCDEGLVITTPTASDPCTLVSMGLISDITTPLGNCAQQYLRILTYEAEDLCGNTSDTIATIRVFDDVAPIITRVPSNEIVECDGANNTIEFNAWIADNGGALATENCGDIIWITDIATPVPGCGGTSTTTVTFTATDECGNASIEVSADFIIIDTTPPFVEDANLPNFTDIECGGTMPSTDPITGTDLCTNIVTVSNAVVTSTNGDDCSGSTVTYTWNLSDGCGNSDEVSVNFEILPDMQAPTFTFQPSMILPINCDDDLPGFQNLVAADNCGLPTIETSFTLTTNPACVGNTLTQTWTTTDQCNNSFSVNLDIQILPDTEPPTLSCEDLLINASPISCDALVMLTPPDIEDNCTEYTLSSNIPGDEGIFPVGTHEIIWEASAPGCGVDATCTQTLIVKDDTAPVLNCPPFDEVCLNATGSGSRCAADLFSPIDNCPGDLDVAIYLIGQDACDQVSNSSPDDKAMFCCEQVGQTVMLVGQAEDLSGNIERCTIDIIVRDKIAPVCAITIPSVTISCSYDYDILDLSEFGTYVDDMVDITTGTIEDPELGTIPVGDGLITDNCDLTIRELSPTVNVGCGGTIIRNFEAEDPSGNIATCTQTINVAFEESFNETNIIWPDSIELFDLCIDMVDDPPAFGVPELQNVNCAQIFQTHSDQYFEIGDGCFKLRRTWSIVDWCQYDPNEDENAGRFNYVQLIKLTNTNPPVFDNCEDLVQCGSTDDCVGLINTAISATDDCAGSDLNYAYSIDIFNDNDPSNDISGTTNVISGLQVPYGEHMITWLANDGCGNTASCSQNVTVKDCENPVATCIYGIAINLGQMPQGIMAEIWAKDYDASSYDNCTAIEDLEFAFDENFTQPSLLFDCSDLGVQEISLYVRDDFGNVSHCVTFIEVQDNFGFCRENAGGVDNEMARISGEIITEDNKTLKNVSVTMSTNTQEHQVLTDGEGEYAFDEIPMYQDVEIQAGMDDVILNGVSTLDILYIQKHILGMERLETPYKIIAADVNRNDRVTGSDILEIRKVILGLADAYSSEKTWEFVDLKHTFDDAANPFPLPEIMTVHDIDTDMNQMDFIGVKLGDVDNSYIHNAEGNFNASATQRNNDATFQYTSLERGLIQITVKQKVVLSGFQLDLLVDSGVRVLDITSDHLDIGVENYSIDHNKVTLSWSAGEPITIEESELLTLHLSDASGLYISETGLVDEWYDEELNTIPFGLVEAKQKEWKVYRNTPNPFSDETFLSFYNHQEGVVSLTIFDNIGNTIYQEQEVFNTGNHEWTVTSKMLGNVHGVLFYRLESGEQSSTHPFIRLN